MQLSRIPVRALPLSVRLMLLVGCHALPFFSSWFGVLGLRPFWVRVSQKICFCPKYPQTKAFVLKLEGMVTARATKLSDNLSRKVKRVEDWPKEPESGGMSMGIPQRKPLGSKLDPNGRKGAKMARKGLPSGNG